MTTSTGPDLVRFCLVGGGRAGRVHAATLTRHLSGAAITAVVDADEGVRQAAEADFAPGHGYATIADALEDGGFDAVVITTPTFTHAELAVQAAKGGKHVFLEKPMALSLAECDAIIAACEEAGVRLQIGFMRRFDPEFRAAFERIEGGEIGQPMVVKSLTHGPGLPPPWARDLAKSNGMLAEVNSHDLDCVRWLMGSDPIRVMSETANFKGKARGVDDPDFYDTVLTQLRFDNGGLGSVSGICPCDYGYDARVEIVGEKGIMQIGDMRGQAIVACTDRDGGLRTPIYRTWPQRFAWGYIEEMRHFVDCIREGRDPEPSGADGRWAVALVLAGRRSIAEDRSVTIAEVM
ncbi:Gfo/Idh/MocA family oxidoreductase [Bauldia sp.]|uniref:Gfo/Idh/MocA family oxidoreductase n=1 Tax=Bauldia sp. TaxID=2575872 RepID=UPI003BAA54D8